MTHDIAVDVNGFIDVALLGLGIPPEKVGRPNRSVGVNAFLDSIRTPWVLDEVEGTTRPIVSLHIGRGIVRHLPTYLPEGKDVMKVVRSTIALLNASNNCMFEEVEEDYEVLRHQCFVNFGTDIEDEAVAQCAIRNKAGVFSADHEFVQHLRLDRKIHAWEPYEFAQLFARTRL